MTHADRIKTEYGSIRAALEYCVDFPMNKAQSRDFLAVNNAFISQWSKRLKVTFPNGMKLQDRTLNREIKSQQMKKMNAARKGKAAPHPYFKQMSPIEHNGLTWYPGEPQFHYLRSLKNGKAI